MCNRLKSIKLLLLDVDGVVTDGSIIYGDDGAEIKVFNVKDGLGIRLLIEAGVQVGVITGRCSMALAHRCRDLGIELLFDGVRDKADALNAIEKKTGIPSQEMAWIGDDLPDLGLMGKVGLFVCVADAHSELIERADLVTTAKGGAGAVREVSEALLKAKGLWDSLVQRFFS